MGAGYDFLNISSEEGGLFGVTVGPNFLKPVASALVLGLALPQTGRGPEFEGFW